MQPSNDTADPDRNDNSGSPGLKRKRSSQGDIRAPRASGTYQRNKAPTACLVCRQRKTKCDNVLPVCGFCKANGGDCQYSKPKELRFDPASIAILQRLETLESNLGNLIKDNAGSARSCDRTSGNRGVFPPANDDPTIAPASPAGAEDTDDELESPPNSAALLRASSDMSIESMLKWPLFKKRLTSFQATFIPRLTGFPASEEFLVPDDQLDLRPHVVYPLVESFIVNSLPSNPILDPEFLRRKVGHLLSKGFGWDGDSCLVLLVLALGSISRPVQHSKASRKIDTAKNDAEFRLGESFFWAAQRRIGMQFHHNHYLAAQLAFFTGVYFGFTMRIVAAWKAFAQAGTQCLAHFVATGVMDAPPATSPAASNDGSIGRLVLQDSLYWAILKGEAELCFELGLPASALHECEYPHVYPEPPNLDQVSMPPGEAESPEAHRRKHFITGWFYYLGEIALRRLQNRALHFRYSDSRRVVRWNESNEQWFMEKLADFDEQLDQWLRSLPESLKFDPTSPAPLHDHLRWVLRVHRMDVIEILRFPAYRALVHLELGSGASGLTPSTIDTTREYLANAKLRIDLRAEEFLHRHQGSFLTIRNCTRSALGLIGAKLKCIDVDENLAKTGEGNVSVAENRLADGILPPQWEQTVESVLNMLRVWEEENEELAHLRSAVEVLFRACFENKDTLRWP